MTTIELQRPRTRQPEEPADIESRNILEEQRRRRLRRLNKKNSKRLLSRKEVLARVPLSYPTLWDMMQKGTFPRSRAIGDQKACWLESEIDDFIDGLPVKPLKGDPGHVTRSGGRTELVESES